MGLRYTGQATETSTLRDCGAGVTIEFEYARPTARQMAAYHADTVVRRGNQVQLDKIGAAVRHLPQVLRGFRFPNPAEAIEVEVEGQWTPLSCVQGEPGYRQDWLEIIAKLEMKLLVELGSDIFAGVIESNKAQAAARALAEAPDQDGPATAPDPDDGGTEVSQGVEGQPEDVPLSRMKPSGSA